MTIQKIAYLINQYPMVSHSFIRREILALERQGFEVQRIALRGWDSAIVDDEDTQERSRTGFVLKQGVTPLLWALVRTMITVPARFFTALRLAIQLGRHADRPLPYHLAYLAEACRVLGWMKDFGATHLHAHFGTNSAEVAMLAHVLGGPPYNFTIHGPKEFDMPLFLGIREKVRRAAFVVAISSYGRCQIYRWIDFADWQKIIVVHCGLGPAYAESKTVPLPDTRRLVCVGRLCEQKGQLLLIEAVARLVAKGLSLEVVLAGDGEMRLEIEKAITRHQLEHHVSITGWISSERVRDEILAASALILPSFAEGLPVVIMEAMALRRPVLTTYVAGIPELVRHGENGWLFPAGDIDELMAAIEDFFSRPLDDLRRMGDAAYLRGWERHAIDTEAAKLAVNFRKSNR